MSKKMRTFGSDDSETRTGFLDIVYWLVVLLSHEPFPRVNKQHQSWLLGEPNMYNEFQVFLTFCLC